MCAVEWTNTWVTRAQQFGINVSVVQMDEALYRGVDVYGGSMSTVASEVATNVATIQSAFPGVQIGDIEPFPSNSPTDIQAWMGALDTAGVHLSSFTPDIQWSSSLPVAPLASLQQLSSNLQADGTQLSIIYNGNTTDPSGVAWARTAEQRIAAVASDPAIDVSAGIIQTWQPFPTSATPTDQPGTVANLTAEYTALEPLYNAGDISQGGLTSYSFSVPSAFQSAVGTATLMRGLNCTMDASDVADNARVAVVLVDLNGGLSAQQKGSGTVGGNGSNELALSGTAADINAELATVAVTATASGDDTLDIESFDGLGQINDTQVSMAFSAASAPPPPTSGVGTTGGLTPAQQIEMVYIGYYDRAADGAGFNYWLQQDSQMVGSGANAPGVLDNIADAFASQPETSALYPLLGGSNPDLQSAAGQPELSAFISNAYQNLFGHPADASGADYWINAISSGSVSLSLYAPGDRRRSVGDGRGRTREQG